MIVYSCGNKWITNCRGCFYFRGKMKQCSKCKEWKEEIEFGKEKRVKSGLRAACNKCYKEYEKSYRQSEHGKTTRKIYRQTSEKSKIIELKHKKKYRESEKGIEVMKRAVKKYRQTEKGRKTGIIIIRRYRQKHPERMAAHTAIANAKSSGRISYASEFMCAICKEKQAIQYHHPDYAKPLEVIPVCMKCHLKIHGRIK